MSTRTRRRLEFSQREQLFLREAHRQICEDGLLSLRMARVAHECDYATGTLYQHFASKEDMLLALSADLAETRLGFFQRAFNWQAESRARQFAFAVADILFACQHPEHFQLEQYTGTQVVWNAASRKRRDAVLNAYEPVITLVCRLVHEADAAGDLKIGSQKAVDVTLGPWALTQGVQTLIHSDGVIDRYDLTCPYRQMLRHQHLLLNGMGWQPLVNANDDAILGASIDRVLKDVFPELHHLWNQTDGDPK